MVPKNFFLPSFRKAELVCSFTSRLFFIVFSSEKKVERKKGKGLLIAIYFWGFFILIWFVFVWYCLNYTVTFVWSFLKLGEIKCGSNSLRRVFLFSVNDDYWATYALLNYKIFWVYWNCIEYKDQTWVWELFWFFQIDLREDFRAYRILSVFLWPTNETKFVGIESSHCDF